MHVMTGHFCLGNVTKVTRLTSGTNRVHPACAQSKKLLKEGGEGHNCSQRWHRLTVAQKQYDESRLLFCSSDVSGGTLFNVKRGVIVHATLL